MILLSVVRPEGPQLAVKTPLGTLALADARSQVPEGDSRVPRTLDEALAEPGGLERVRRYVDSVLSRVDVVKPLMRPENEVRIAVPFTPRSIICVGLNYRSHAAERGREVPERPILFAKLRNSLIGPGEPILLPPDTAMVDYEAELAVVIGRRCRRVSSEEALDYVAGYSCLDDVSARDFQRGDGQWLRAKSQDTFCPMGPYLVTRDEIPDPQTLGLRCWVNGELRQDSNTSEMIFPVKQLIAFISRGMTLEPGDVIGTGTPSGVGAARNPPAFLAEGDEVVVELERVGELSNSVRKNV